MVLLYSKTKNTRSQCGLEGDEIAKSDFDFTSKGKAPSTGVSKGFAQAARAVFIVRAGNFSPLHNLYVIMVCV